MWGSFSRTEVNSEPDFRKAWSSPAAHTALMLKYCAKIVVPHITTFKCNTIKSFQQNIVQDFFFPFPIFPHMLAIFPRPVQEQQQSYNAENSSWSDQPPGSSFQNKGHSAYTGTPAQLAGNCYQMLHHLPGFVTAASWTDQAGFLFLGWER